MLDIYFDNSDEWELEPDYMPMNGYYYCFVELNFDGVLDLVVNVNDGSGGYSENSYYTIDTQNKKVIKLSSDEDIESTFDLFTVADYPQLYKNKNDGKLYYYCADYLRVMTGEYNCTYGFLSLDSEGKINSQMLFSQYHCDAGLENNNKVVDEYGYYENSNHKKSDKETYDKKYNEFFAGYEKLDLTYQTILGIEYEKMNEKQKKNALLESYKKFEYK